VTQIEERSHAEGGAQAGLEDFAAAHGQALLTFAYLLTGGHRAQAEDLVQTVLTRLVARGLQGLDEPRAYARRSLVNEYTSQGRRGSTYQRVLARWSGSDRDHAPGPQPEDRLAVLDALRDLTERERSVIVLRYYEDLPDVEIAEIVGCSRSTVRSIVHRALPKLRERLDSTYGPGHGGATETSEGSGRGE
jgi:RNA polymerase sigma factor (sigma-70 family)